MQLCLNNDLAKKGFNQERTLEQDLIRSLLETEETGTIVVTVQAVILTSLVGGALKCEKYSICNCFNCNLYFRNRFRFKERFSFMLKI